jgi:predicted MFS family arabinose efflux permease
MIGSAGQGFVQSWLVMAAVSAAGLLFAVLFLPSPVLHTAGASRREPALKWTPRLVALIASYGIFGFGYIVTATFLIAIIRSDGGSVSFEALVWLLTGLAAAVSVAAAQPFVGRYGVASVMTAGCLIEASGVAASVLLPSPFGPIVGGLLLGGTFVVITAYGLQFARSLAPDSQRRILAFMTAAFGIGQIVGPLIAGYLAARSGNYLVASLVAALALFLSAALAVRAGRA